MVSLENPNIQDGAKFLSFMAFKWSGELNFRPNLKRVGDVERNSTHEQETASRAIELRQRATVFNNAALSDSALLSWLGKSTVIEDQNAITIKVENEFVKSRILIDCLVIIQEVCAKEIKVEIGAS
ncbi:MAG: hypothetical protein JKX94_06825 [Sneathiella sp.]|nr:hypothetical protein [Sneathiella sp.]